VTETPTPISISILTVSETASGKLHVIDTETGSVVGTICLTELHPDDCTTGTDGLENPCLLFGVEHAVADGRDVLTFTYTLREPSLPFAPGAIAKFDPERPIEPHWVMTEISFSDAMLAEEGFDCSEPDTEPRCHLYGPHAGIPQEDGQVLIADTSNSRLLWVTPPEAGSTTGTVNRVLSKRHPQMGENAYINHAQTLLDGDSTWVLMTFKGPKGSGAGDINTGRILLWDVTDESTPRLLWSYPEEGYLAAVHQGMVQDTPHGPMLIYAHSLGASNDALDTAGSIGLAAFNGADPPTYLGDGVLVGDKTLGFVREVEWSESAGALIVTDSGCENADYDCGKPGSMVAVTLPEWEPAGQSGAHSSSHTNQSFFTMDEQPIYGPATLVLPYDGDIIPAEKLGMPLREGRLGRCPTP